LHKKDIKMMSEDGEYQRGAIWSRIVIEEVKILTEE